jgi:hypothetical protein
MIRVTTKYLNGLVPETSIASICSVTRMDPSSYTGTNAPSTNQSGNNGPISRIIEILTMASTTRRQTREE